MRKTATSVILGAVLLTGCAATPDYQPREEANERYLDSLEFGVQTADSTAVEWWRSYQDDQLNRLVEVAQKANLDVLATRQRVRQALADLGADENRLLPQGGVTGDYEAIDRNGVQESSSVGLTASWEVDLFGRLKALVDAGEANLEVALNNQRAVLKEVPVGVVRAYLEWEAARQRVQLIKADIRALEDTREVMALRVQEGISPNLDLARADTLLEQQRAKLPDARAQLYRAKAVLSVLVNEDPEALVLNPASSVLTASIGVPEAERANEAMQRRADIGAALAALARNVAVGNALRAELYPQFSVEGFLGLTNVAELSDGFEGTGTIAPRISWSLLSYPVILQRVESQNAVSEESYIRYRQTIIDAVASARVAVFAYGRAFEADRATGRAFEAANESFTIATTMHREGAIGYLDLLDAIRTFISAQQDRLSARLSYAAAQLGVIEEFSGVWSAEAHRRMLQDTIGES
ncbi:MAG: TolC family protein [Oleiphilaceae bacterium]|nr:TolC family protein [Oleiphilaceae bacterium]